MIGVKLKDRIRNRFIRSKTRVEDVTIKVKTLKWRWTGHIIWGKEKWSKRIIWWFLKDRKRKHGPPKMRWEDEIVKFAGRHWTRLAR